MVSQPPVMDEAQTSARSADGGGEQPAAPRRARTPLRQILHELRWRLILPVGLITGLLWTVLIGQALLTATPNTVLQLVAGLLPVTAGILLGRRIQQHVGWHAALLGLITTLAALLGLGGLALLVGPQPALVMLMMLAVLTLMPFPAFGMITSASGEARRRQLREELARRGGRLERPGKVRSLDDLRSLSLPQLGGYVSELFRRHDFKLHDYRFEKDRLDLRFTYEDEPWLVRVTTAEKVKPGLAVELSQRMKEEGVRKGVVITSMDFQESATRWAKDKPIVLIDGATLLSMDEKLA
ncbi:restriction endonuclease [Kallotenue papyrolyticum]|uniref:restriction endonuclease n=1 Tax=Kallotenue papyrolyticum TaxID=1325125 RepID=UPI00049272B3|nr:restriction endonuclease [Kallotenue papyrolyticum]